MPNDWSSCTLGDVVTLVTKGTTPPKGQGFVDYECINYIKSESISYDGRIDKAKFVQIDEITHQKFKRSQIQECDILFSMAGAFLGKNAVVSSDVLPANTNQALAIIRVDQDKVQPHFVSYCLRNPNMIKYVNGMVAQSAQPNINFKEIRSLPLNLPPLHEQKAIAHILGTLDDKIELNRQMNETLEAMAQALFKSWFVDFDPVIDKALAAGNLPTGQAGEIPEALQKRAQLRQQVPNEKKLIHTNPGLTGHAELVEAFPDRFTFTEELGWIPEGWEVDVVSRACNKAQNGGTPRRNEDSYWIDGNIPWLTSGEVRDGIITKTENSITDIGLEKSSAKLVPKLTSLVAMYGATAGQVAITGIPLTTNQAICSLIPKTDAEIFVQLCLKMNVRTLENQARGSAQQNISKGIIEGLKVVFPTDEILQSFNSTTSPIYDKIFSNILMSDNLEKIRNILLPKLISGELKVPEAEKIIADHV